MEAPELFAHRFLKEFNSQVVQRTRQHKASKTFLDVMEVTTFEVESVLKAFNHMESDTISEAMYVI